MSGFFLEIELDGMDLALDGGRKMGVFRQIYAFNIFSVAFIGDRCMGYWSWMGCLSGAEVSEIMLKWGIRGR